MKGESAIAAARRFLPVLPTRVVALAAFVGGAFVWLVLWNLMRLPRPTDPAVAERVKALLWGAGAALGPTGAAFSIVGIETPAGPPAMAIGLGCVENGLFWALLLGAANWGRTRLRPLMWAVVGFVALWWALVAIIVAGHL